MLKVQSLGPTFEALKAFKAADRPGVFSDKELWEIQSDLWKVAHAALAHYVAKALGTLQTDAE